MLDHTVQRLDSVRGVEHFPGQYGQQRFLRYQYWLNGYIRRSVYAYLTNRHIKTTVGLRCEVTFIPFSRAICATQAPGKRVC